MNLYLCYVCHIHNFLGKDLLCLQSLHVVLSKIKQMSCLGNTWISIKIVLFSQHMSLDSIYFWEGISLIYLGGLFVVWKNYSSLFVHWNRHADETDFLLRKCYQILLTKKDTVQAINDIYLYTVNPLAGFERWFLGFYEAQAHLPQDRLPSQKHFRKRGRGVGISHPQFAAPAAWALTTHHSWR